MTTSTRSGDYLRSDVRIEVRYPDRATSVVRVAGEVDLVTSASLAELLERGIDARPAEVVLDLSQVTFLDSAGLSVVLAATQHAWDTGTRMMTMTGSSAAVRRILDATSVDPNHEHRETAPEAWPA